MGRRYEEDDFEDFAGAEEGGGAVLELEVVLRDTKPPVRRRLLVDAETPLDHLHRILQLAMGWSNTHLHQFVADDMKYSDPEFELEWAEDESHYVLRDLADKAEASFQYEYDFKDGWVHDVNVVRILTVQEAGDFPACVDGERACPPEACGGPEALADLQKKDDYDPPDFDTEPVNREIGNL